MAEVRAKAVSLIILFFTLFSAASASADGLIFSITEWDTGPVEPGIVAEQAVEVLNDTGGTVNIDLISTCSCLGVSPQNLSLAPSETGRFSISFDSSEDRGDFEKLLIIQSDSPAMPKGFFIVSGTVAAAADESSEAPAEQSGDSAPAGESSPEKSKDTFYFYTPGCRSCNRFIDSAEIPLVKKDITVASNYEQLQEILEQRGEPLVEIPVMITPSGVFQGEEAIRSGYDSILRGTSAPEQADDQNVQEGVSARGISLLPVLAAGLLDGVNPCAFTTLIFLLSALTVAGRSRRETLVIGLFFTLSVFLTYYLIGLGFFKIIRIANSFSLVSSIIRWVLFGVLVIFAALSFYDYGKIRSGRATEIVLQLPDGVKRRMHSSIRSYTKSAALAGSSIVMGFLISVFELGCTGQIYFPTITYIIQTGNDASGYLFLAFYNLAFILPLAVVFIIIYMGITSKKITGVFQTNMGLIKILTGVLFLAFAALMLVL